MSPFREASAGSTAAPGGEAMSRSSALALSARRILRSLDLNRERIYIVPTWYGLAYVLGLVAAFIHGALTDNHLIYLLGFVLMTFFLVGMFQTNGNLKGVEVSEVESQPGPADGHVPMVITVANLASEPRFALGIQLTVSDRLLRTSLPLLGPGQRAQIPISLPVGPRGEFPIPRIRLFSLFPLGLFYAWKWKPPTGTYLVYPRPQGSRELHPTIVAQPRQTPSLLVGDDFSGHRPYQKGDPLRLIDWKARARGLPWMVKRFDRNEAGALALRWSTLEGLSTEARLSQLSLWAHDCERNGESYSLELPGSSVASGHDRRHFHDCLRLLATYTPPKGDSDAP